MIYKDYRESHSLLKKEQYFTPGDQCLSDVYQIKMYAGVMR